MEFNLGELSAKARYKYSFPNKFSRNSCSFGITQQHAMKPNISGTEINNNKSMTMELLPQEMKAY
jgi:hypothetical protein